MDDDDAQVPETLTEIVHPEGGVQLGAPTPATVVAWLFGHDAPPQQIPLGESAAFATNDACFVWVDLNGFDVAELEEVAELLALPGAAVKVALAGWHRPRLDVYSDRFFVAATVPFGDLAQRHVVASQLALFVGRNALVSAHTRPLPFTNQVMARATQNPSMLKLDSAFLLFLLIDELLAHYEALTEGLEDEIEVLEERALSSVSDPFLEDLLLMKRFVFAVYRLASQHLTVLEAFQRPDSPLVGGEVITPYFRDLNVRLGRMVDGLEAAKDSINGAFALYDSRASQRTNEIMRVLTIISSVLLPASVILGFFGTQYQDPPLTTFTGFIIMVLLIGLTTTSAIVLFSRLGWIGRSRGSTSSPLRRRLPSDV